jgi:hypothetical protein
VEKQVNLTWFFFAIVVVVFSTKATLFAQETASPSLKQLKSPNPPEIFNDSESTPDADWELLKKDLRSQKKQIVAANMNLTDDEAEKFWPVYDKYAWELAKIYDRKILLIGTYIENYQTMKGDEAEAYIRQRAAIEQEVMQIRLKYVPEFRKVLSGRQTALFFQIDWRLDLLINLQLADVPVIDP